MGSTNFEQYMPDRDGRGFEAVYRRATDAATDEFGTDSYNGSISTTGGVTLDTHTPMTREEASARAARRLDRYDKWEAAGAIPVLDDAVVTRRTVKVIVDLDGEPAWDARQGLLEAAARAKVRLRDGERITQVTEQRATLTDPTAGARERFTVTTTAGRAPRETRFFVLDDQGQVMGDTIPTGPANPRLWDYGHDSQAKARAHAERLARRPGASGSATFTVEGRTRRDLGEPLVTVRRQLVGAKVPVEVTVARQTGDRVGGWLFFGWVAT